MKVIIMAGGMGTRIQSVRADVPKPMIEICGKPISKWGKRCVKCAHIGQRKTTLPEREVLKQLIREKPFTQIGNIYNVTDNAVRKWCDSYNLPRTKKEIKSYSDEQWELI